jgi:hypothetical protein
MYLSKPLLQQPLPPQQMQERTLGRMVFARMVDTLGLAADNEY